MKAPNVDTRAQHPWQERSKEYAAHIVIAINAAHPVRGVIGEYELDQGYGMSVDQWTHTFRCERFVIDVYVLDDGSSCHVEQDQGSHSLGHTT